ncbi:hypothetical protein RMSM_07708 [Rhodopirellula maiorica SM1]|uniref:Uncharacterized protein n=1 Tax=Rhodopirellula maiorica SM1 TaxID=1265738 RepID=M5RN31_9BACT|nr:hypothetical protein RMSM_07708 [Rhodopirellula maiorica SM1]
MHRSRIGGEGGSGRSSMSNRNYSGPSQTGCRINASAAFCRR